MNGASKARGRSKTVLAMIAATSVVAGSALGAGSASAAPSSGCAPMMAYMVPGTTETNTKADPSTPKGMLSKVGNALKKEFGDKIKVVYVPYEASAFDKGMTYKASEFDGVARTAALMAKCKDSEIVLSGYSQGADVAGDIAWHIGRGNGPVPANKVRGVGLLADPKRGNNPAVGVALGGRGISGERPGGYGALEGRVKWVCDNADLYCNVTSKNPFLKTLGSALGSGGPNGEVAPLDGKYSVKDDAMSTLSTDFDGVQLADVPGKAKELQQRTESLANSGKAPSSSEIDQITELANSLNKTSTQVGDAKKFADDSGVRKALAEEKGRTPGAQTSDVLDALDKVDLNKTASDAGQIAQLASSLSSGSTGSGDLVAGGEAIKSLALKGADICSQMCQLSSVDRTNLGAATSMLSGLQVQTTVETSLSAVTTVLSTDYQGLITNLGLLPQQIAASDVKGAHRTAQTINKQLEPWVLLAAEANDSEGAMGMAANMVGMIPDPYGIAPIASIVMKFMANVDIIGLAHQVGQAQEVAWAVAEGHPEKMVELVPIGLGLTQIGLGVLTGGAKSDPSLLKGGTPQDAATIAKATGGSGSFLDLTKALGSGATLDQMITDGLDAFSFLRSTAHTGAYTSKTVVGDMNGVEYLAAYFSVQLGRPANNGGAPATTGTDKPDATDGTTATTEPGATEETDAPDATDTTEDPAETTDPDVVDGGLPGLGS